MNDVKVTIILAEYNAYKEAIKSTEETIRSIVNIVFVLFTAQLSLMTAVISVTIKFNGLFIRIIFLLIPECCILLSMYHSQCVMRIHNYSNYIDIEIGKRLKKITGEQLINNHSKHSTKNIFKLVKSPTVSKIAFLSKLGIMLAPVTLSLVFWLAMCINCNVTIQIIEWIMFALGIVCAITLFFMQHD